MRRRNRFSLTCIAAMTASAFCTVVPAGLPATGAADNPDAGQLPDWIPVSYGAALQFVNTYGGTHIEDGLLCVVLCENEVRAPDAASPQYEITVSGEAVQELSHQFYSVPDNGSYYVMDLDVFVYQPVRSGSFQISLSGADAEPLTDYERDPYLPDYQFSVDENLVITETDPYGWAPDCITEFKAFRDRHGAFSANGNLIVACLNPQLTVTETYVEAVSSDAVRKIGMWGCSERHASLTGVNGPAWHTKTQAVLYEAVSDGLAEISWQVKDSVESSQRTGLVVDRSQRITGNFLIMDNAQTVLKSDDARITLLDADTDAPVTVTAASGFALYQIVNSPYAKPLIARLSTNPAIVRDLGNRIDAEHPSLENASFALAVPEGFAYTEGSGTLMRLENGAFDICYKVKRDPSGETGTVLNIADAEALIKWLIANPESQLADWKAYDCDGDGVLRAADLTLLKRKLMNPDRPDVPDPIEAATKMPAIVDESGTVTDSMKEALRAEVLKNYPGSDLSDFRLVYAADHPLTKQAGGACFYVYYQNTLVHGLGDLDLPNNVYAAVREDGKATVQLLASPEAYLLLDLTGEDASEALMQNRYKGDKVDRIIYASRDNKVKPVQVAYRVIITVFSTEEIYAESGGRLVSIQLPSK